jgi:thymidylate synthase (FAD)
MMMKKEVLDKGYVRLVDVLGSDLTPVNAARVSYDKESSELSDKDERLLKFLAREGHTSPFRHAMLQFEVYAPLMVARQW